MGKTEWNDLAAQLAVDSIRCSTAAGSGHPTSSLSAAHLAAVLFSDHLRFDVDDPSNLGNDRFVLSKGHASPLFFSVLKAIGAIDDAQLMSFRKFGSPIQGHPAPAPGMPWVDVATGSLGQGMPIGLGMALAMRLDGLPGRVWVTMGDSEVAEGSVWEAMENASFHGLRNLIGILDMNRLGQRGPTMLQWEGDVYAARAEAFGWRGLCIDGHDVEAIDHAYREAEDASAPTLIVAKTEKGHGVSFLADKEGWHGKALSPEEATRAIEELGGERHIAVTPPKPDVRVEREPFGAWAETPLELPRYEAPEATRKAFGDTLVAMAARPDVVVLDGEVGNSTHTEEFMKAAPDRFVQMYIAEQAMVGAAVGLQALGKNAFAATFGAFLTRAYDFIRMAAISRANLRLCGSHAGVSIGEDGPSQMALEDIAMMRAVHGSTVLYPADANATAQLVPQMADIPGIVYMRTTREKTPALYAPEDDFHIGGSKTVRDDGGARVTIVGAGVSLFQGLEAADQLATDGIPSRVIDAYSIKPIDRDTLQAALRETGLIVTVEDHWIEGGLGDAVLAALAEDGADLSGRALKIGVTQMAGSGSPEELRDWAGISATTIAGRVRSLLA
ncbi:MAG TPA: transketolase [Actinomycetota bacterium]|nr:transketolase [Actinomycetota bacterium]